MQLTLRQRRPIPKLEKKKLKCMWTKIGKIKQSIHTICKNGQKLRKSKQYTGVRLTKPQCT